MCHLGRAWRGLLISAPVGIGWGWNLPRLLPLSEGWQALLSAETLAAEQRALPGTEASSHEPASRRACLQARAVPQEG